MGKTAFVTGGSRVIGRAVVRQLAAEGYSIGISYLQPALIYFMLSHSTGRCAFFASSLHLFKDITEKLLKFTNCSKRRQQILLTEEGNGAKLLLALEGKEC